MKLTFEMFDIEKKIQGHGVQHSQRFFSMGNINLYKSRNLKFFASPTVFEIFLHFKIRDLDNVSSSRSGAIRWQIPDFLSDGKYLTSYLMANSWLPIWWQIPDFLSDGRYLTSYLMADTWLLIWWQIPDFLSDGKYLTSYLMANTWLPIWWQIPDLLSDGKYLTSYLMADTWLPIW